MQDPLLYFAVFAQLLLSELTGLLCQIYPNFPARCCTRVTGCCGWELAFVAAGAITVSGDLPSGNGAWAAGNAGDEKPRADCQT